jgi:phosphoribosylpyrophosphate synthetase
MAGECLIAVAMRPQLGTAGDEAAKFSQRSVAPLLGEAIRRIHTGQSVGALFNGR